MKYFYKRMLSLLLALTIVMGAITVNEVQAVTGGSQDTDEVFISGSESDPYDVNYPEYLWDRSYIAAVYEDVIRYETVQETYTVIEPVTHVRQEEQLISEATYKSVQDYYVPTKYGYRTVTIEPGYYVNKTTKTPIYGTETYVVSPAEYREVKDKYISPVYTTVYEPYTYYVYEKVWQYDPNLPNEGRWVTKKVAKTGYNAVQKMISPGYYTYKTIVVKPAEYGTRTVITGYNYSTERVWVPPVTESQRYVVRSGYWVYKTVLDQPAVYGMVDVEYTVDEPVEKTRTVTRKIIDSVRVDGTGGYLYTRKENLPIEPSASQIKQMFELKACYDVANEEDKSSIANDANTLRDTLNDDSFGASQGLSAFFEAYKSDISTSGYSSVTLNDDISIGGTTLVEGTKVQLVKMNTDSSRDMQDRLAAVIYSDGSGAKHVGLITLDDLLEYGGPKEEPSSTFSEDFDAYLLAIQRLEELPDEIYYQSERAAKQQIIDEFLAKYGLEGLLDEVTYDELNQQNIVTEGELILWAVSRQDELNFTEKFEQFIQFKSSFEQATSETLKGIYEEQARDALSDLGANDELVSNLMNVPIDVLTGWCDQVISLESLIAKYNQWINDQQTELPDSELSIDEERAIEGAWNSFNNELAITQDPNDIFMYGVHPYTLYMQALESGEISSDDISQETYFKTHVPEWMLNDYEYNTQFEQGMIEGFSEDFISTIDLLSQIGDVSDLAQEVLEDENLRNELVSKAGSELEDISQDLLIQYVSGSLYRNMIMKSFTMLYNIAQNIIESTIEQFASHTLQYNVGYVLGKMAFEVVGELVTAGLFTAVKTVVSKAIAFGFETVDDLTGLVVKFLESDDLKLFINPLLDESGAISIDLLTNPIGSVVESATKREAVDAAEEIVEDAILKNADKIDDFIVSSSSLATKLDNIVDSTGVVNQKIVDNVVDNIIDMSNTGELTDDVAVEALEALESKNLAELDDEILDIKEAAETFMDGNQYTKVDRLKTLKPDITYQTPGGHLYKTDSLGRINSVEGSLESVTASRSTYSQRVAGRGDRLPTDDGGHLIASQFNGSGGLDNLVPMDSTLNRAGGDWYKMEQEWAEALADGSTVDVNIQVIYEGASQRPKEFVVKYTIDGDVIVKTWQNTIGGN